MSLHCKSVKDNTIVWQKYNIGEEISDRSFHKEEMHECAVSYILTQICSIFFKYLIVCRKIMA